jgi:hypothetical protein
MAMDEINPEHPVTSGLHDHWHKIVAVLLHKLSPGQEVVLTAHDIAAVNQLFGYDQPAVLAHDKKDGLHLSLVSMSKAKRMGMV